ncbi:stage II sporulation protein M [Effusibacillus pohliae]|uniref:stage II sporulation protein M n=1 Tax=Effusibacillus pohliae TaxID=232270 RepID=UPI0003786684|nr:stage II sporulation protein M [Effusibacillus pohliae]
MRPLSVIRHNRGYIGFSLILFVLGLLIGVVFFETLHGFLKQYLEKIQSLASGAKDDHLNLAWLIFKNNLLASFGLLVSGIFLSIFAINGIVLNGMVVGYALVLMGKTGQVPVWALVLLGILPHGVLEIPAFLLAGAMGIKLGYMWLRPIAGKSRWSSFRHAFAETLNVTPVIVGLLLGAAAMEGFVTPALLKWYMH